MRDLQTSAAFVVGSGRKLLGVVRDRDVLRAGASAGERDLDGDRARRPRDRRTATQHLADLFEPAVESQLPGRRRRRRAGACSASIPRVTLLAALGNVPTNTGENPVIEPPATVAVDVITADPARRRAGTTDEVDRQGRARRRCRARRVKRSLA